MECRTKKQLVHYNAPGGCKYALAGMLCLNIKRFLTRRFSNGQRRHHCGQFLGEGIGHISVRRWCGVDIGVGGKIVVTVAKRGLDILEAITKVEHDCGTTMTKLMQAENGDYSIITTKIMLKCCGKDLPWHFHFARRFNNGKEK